MVAVLILFTSLVSKFVVDIFKIVHQVEIGEVAAVAICLVK